MTIPEPGLRERKKRETARAIEVAAVELVAEHGLAEVTIEAISARADVTSRTFFNYYAGKDDAVLGHSRMFPPPSLRELQVEPGRDILSSIIASLRDQVSAFDLGSRDFQASRRAVLVAHPELLATDFEKIGVIEEEFAVQVERLLDAEGLVPAADRTERAWALLMLVGGTLRLAMRSWSLETGTPRPLTAHIDAAHQALLSALPPTPTTDIRRTP